MQCPNCYSNIAAGSRACPRCDYILVGGNSAAGARFEYDGADREAAPWSAMPTQQPNWSNNAELNQPSLQPEIQLSPFNWEDTRQVVAAPQQTGVERIQLTNSQRNSLRFKAIFGIVFGLIPIGFIFFFIIQFRGFRIQFEPAWLGMLFTLAFIGIPLIMTFISFKAALEMFADANEAIALRQTDVLENKRRIRNNNTTRYYGYFQNIGKMPLSRSQYRDTTKNSVYYITYSPRSKHVWEIDALTPAFQEHQQ